MNTDTIDTASQTDEIVDTFVNAIKEAFVELVLLNEDMYSDLTKYIVITGGYIDVFKSFDNAVKNIKKNVIHLLINEHCDKETVYDHWQQVYPEQLEDERNIVISGAENMSSVESYMNLAYDKLYAMIGIKD